MQAVAADQYCVPWSWGAAIVLCASARIDLPRRQFSATGRSGRSEWRSDTRRACHLECVAKNGREFFSLIVGQESAEREGGAV